MKVTLEFRGPLLKAPPKSKATCEARLTASQVVVESGTVTEGTNVLGGLPYRFHRIRGGRPIPMVRHGWRLSDESWEEVKKSNHDAT
jgi:hypothetical protein